MECMEMRGPAGRNMKENTVSLQNLEKVGHCATSRRKRFLGQTRGRVRVGKRRKKETTNGKKLIGTKEESSWSMENFKSIMTSVEGTISRDEGEVEE